MKYKITVGMEGPNVSLIKGDYIELTPAQVPSMVEAGIIEIEPSALEKVKKTIKESKPKKESKKSKKK